MLKATGKLAQVSGKDVHIDPEDHYDSWAESYNKDLLEQYGYCAHKLAVNAFQKVHANRKKPIIDVGCGTGLVGLEMARIGYETIDGLDVSKGMLDKARALGIYRKLFQKRIGCKNLSTLAGYSGVLCVGSFGLGHMLKDDILPLIKMAASNAPIVIFMNAEPFETQGYITTLKRLIKEGLWIIERLEDHNYMSALNRPGKLIVGRRV